MFNSIHVNRISICLESQVIIALQFDSCVVCGYREFDVLIFESLKLYGLLNDLYCWMEWTAYSSSLRSACIVRSKLNLLFAYLLFWRQHTIVGWKYNLVIIRISSELLLPNFSKVIRCRMSTANCVELKWWTANEGACRQRSTAPSHRNNFVYGSASGKFRTEHPSLIIKYGLHDR